MAKQNAIDNKSQELTIDPGASGDSFVQFDINGTGEFRIGVDDDAGDAFKIASGSALGTNDTFVITDDGHVTKPLTCCFGAYATNQANVTGDGTSQTVTFAGGEYFDQNDDFASPTFTAPVTGRYLLSTIVTYEGIAAGHTYGLLSMTLTGGGTSVIKNAAASMNSSNQFSQVAMGVFEMTAADTAIIRLIVYNGAKTIDIIGANTYFFGCLLT